MKSPTRTVLSALVKLKNASLSLGAVFLLLLFGRGASATTLYLSGFTSPVITGSTLTIGVYADSYTDLYAWQFDLNWNPSVLSLVSISEGSALQPAGATYFVPGTIDNLAGMATANVDTLLGAGPGANGSAETLADFTFTAISSGVSPLTIGGVILLDSNLNLIDVNTVPSTIDVTNTPSPVPEPGSFLLLGTGLLLLITYKFRRMRVHLRLCGLLRYHSFEGSYCSHRGRTS